MLVSLISYIVQVSLGSSTSIDASRCVFTILVLSTGVGEREGGGGGGGWGVPKGTFSSHDTFQ